MKPLPAVPVSLTPPLFRLQERGMRISFASFTLTQALRLVFLRQGETSLWLAL